MRKYKSKYPLENKKLFLSDVLIEKYIKKLYYNIKTNYEEGGFMEIENQEFYKEVLELLNNARNKVKKTVDNIIIKVKGRENLFRNNKAIQFGRSNLKTITENMTGCFKMI